MLRRLVLFALTCLAITCNAQESQPGDTLIRSITPITDSLYRYQYNMHVSVFLVTPEGILITDPTTVESAEWLRDQLKRRFNKPVRYMIYSHEHSDHIGGASVFDVPGVTIVAHELTKRALADHPLAGARIPMPTVTFSVPMTLHFGGRTIRLFKVEPWTHAQDLIAMHFVEDRTLFAVDLMTVKGVGFFDFSNERFAQMIEAIRHVQQIDYDHLVDSHGPLGTKADGDVYLAYLEALRAGVRTALDRGATLEETQRAVRLERYTGLGMFDAWREMNIQGAYAALKDVALEEPAAKPAVINDAPSAATADSRVRALAVFCSACHGPGGVSSDAHFPNLAGQKYEYLLKALRAYQRQERYDPYMSQLEFLSDADLQGIAHYYSSLPPSP